MDSSGYELINEPWAGDIYRHPDQLAPCEWAQCNICYSSFTTDVADKINLSPMYARLHQAIREVDDDHVIFFEPTIIITSVRD